MPLRVRRDTYHTEDAGGVRRHPGEPLAEHECWRLAPHRSGCGGEAAAEVCSAAPRAPLCPQPGGPGAAHRRGGEEDQQEPGQAAQDGALAEVSAGGRRGHGGRCLHLLLQRVQRAVAWRHAWRDPERLFCTHSGRSRWAGRAVAQAARGPLRRRPALHAPGRRGLHARPRWGSGGLAAVRLDVAPALPALPARVLPDHRLPGRRSPVQDLGHLPLQQAGTMRPALPGRGLQERQEAREGRLLVRAPGGDGQLGQEAQDREAEPAGRRHGARDPLGGDVPGGDGEVQADAPRTPELHHRPPLGRPAQRARVRPAEPHPAGAALRPRGRQQEPARALHGQRRLGRGRGGRHRGRPAGLGEHHGRRREARQGHALGHAERLPGAGPPRQRQDLPGPPAHHGGPGPLHARGAAAAAGGRPGEAFLPGSRAVHGRQAPQHGRGRCGPVVRQVFADHLRRGQPQVSHDLPCDQDEARHAHLRGAGGLRGAEAMHRAVHPAPDPPAEDGGGHISPADWGPVVPGRDRGQHRGHERGEPHRGTHPHGCARAPRPERLRCLRAHLRQGPGRRGRRAPRRAGRGQRRQARGVREPHDAEHAAVLPADDEAQGGGEAGGPAQGPGRRQRGRGRGHEHHRHLPRGHRRDADADAAPADGRQAEPAGGARQVEADRGGGRAPHGPARPRQHHRRRGRGAAARPAPPRVAQPQEGRGGRPRHVPARHRRRPRGDAVLGQGLPQLLRRKRRGPRRGLRAARRGSALGRPGLGADARDALGGLAAAVRARGGAPAGQLPGGGRGRLPARGGPGWAPPGFPVPAAVLRSQQEGAQDPEPGHADPPPRRRGEGLHWPVRADAGWRGARGGARLQGAAGHPRGDAARELPDREVPHPALVQAGAPRGAALLPQEPRPRRAAGLAGARGALGQVGASGRGGGLPADRRLPLHGAGLLRPGRGRRAQEHALRAAGRVLGGRRPLRALRPWAARGGAADAAVVGEAPGVGQEDRVPHGEHVDAQHHAGLRRHHEPLPDQELPPGLCARRGRARRGAGRHPPEESDTRALVHEA
mmetsp:Transcript_90621/g.256167  ORF Transcript_90621/g.256167 Transcript_90621/m.256167 type:complete len:1052 (+) Transcript_90621:1493-4648(+)